MPYIVPYVLMPPRGGWPNSPPGDLSVAYLARLAELGPVGLPDEQVVGEVRPDHIPFSKLRHPGGVRAQLVVELLVEAPGKSGGAELPARVRGLAGEHDHALVG